MNTMKRLAILLATTVVLSSCSRGGSTGDSVSCWMCYLEGKYQGKIIDIDTTICNMDQAGINQFMAPYNTNGTVAVCARKPL
jgi:hypothetical protein